MNEDIQLDSNGNIDTQYYIDRAYEMRREYHAELVKAAKVKLVKLFHIKLPEVTVAKPAHH